MEKCCCDDETLTKTQVCLNCRSEETVKMGRMQRVASCPEHHDSIAICSPAFFLCKKCTKEGYYVKRGRGFMSMPEILKKLK